MYKLFILALYLLLSVTNSAYAQKELTSNELKQITAKKPTVVYVSALWCLPCIKKLKAASDSLERVSDTSVNRLVVFDQLAFDNTKLKKINLAGFDSASFYLIPSGYYSRSLIQINPSKRVLKKYINDIRKAYHSKVDFGKFWFGKWFTVKGQALLFEEDSE